MRRFQKRHARKQQRRLMSGLQALPADGRDLLRTRGALELLLRPASPANVNRSVVRLGVVEGEYHWHKHDADDEFFYVVEGRLLIDLDDRTVELAPRHLSQIALHPADQNGDRCYVCQGDWKLLGNLTCRGDVRMVAGGGELYPKLTCLRIPC